MEPRTDRRSPSPARGPWTAVSLLPGAWARPSWVGHVTSVLEEGCTAGCGPLRNLLGGPVGTRLGQGHGMSPCSQSVPAQGGSAGPSVELCPFLIGSADVVLQQRLYPSPTRAASSSTLYSAPQVPLLFSSAQRRWLQGCADNLQALQCGAWIVPIGQLRKSAPRGYAYCPSLPSGEEGAPAARPWTRSARPLLQSPHFPCRPSIARSSGEHVRLQEWSEGWGAVGS